MKKKKILLPLILLLITFLSLVSCGKESGKETQMSRASYYNDLIKNAVNVSPKQLGIKLSDKEVSVYGVITEQNVGDLLILLSAAYSTGEVVEIIYGGYGFVISGEGGSASGISNVMYETAKKYLKYYESDIEKYWKDQNIQTLSQNLLMTLFIDRNDEIENRVKKFMASAQKYLDNFMDVEKDGSLPTAGELKIIFLTNKGRFFIQGALEQIKETNPDIAVLFQDRSGISEKVFENYMITPKSGA